MKAFATRVRAWDINIKVLFGMWVALGALILGEMIWSFTHNNIWAGCGFWCALVSILTVLMFLDKLEQYKTIMELDRSTIQRLTAHLFQQAASS